jgi:hypothetical protein
MLGDEEWLVFEQTSKELSRNSRQGETRWDEDVVGLP